MHEPAPEERARVPKILVVEDELLIALELQATLEDHGYTVLGPVSTVARAQSLIEERPPDAVILDLNLGDGRSTPVAAWLAANGVPFIVTSGYDAAMSGEATLHGAPWLEKPIRYELLLRHLTRLLGQQHS